MAQKAIIDTRTPEEHELAIELAVKDVKSGEKSYREAERNRGIPKSTIDRRIRGAQPRQEAHADQQALRPAEEAELTTSKRIDERRVMAKNPAYVMEFYDFLNQAIEDYKLSPSKIFNMDEKGFLLGIIGKEKVVILTRDSRDGHAGGAKDYGNRETVTTIDCISADGTVLPPMIIMKGKYVLKQWSESCPELNALWACSPNGWTNNALGVEYIKQFDIWTKDRVTDGSWRCLILDGHGSHLTFDFLHYAYQARILVLGLPSHTTDFLQPLDRVIFRVLQRCYGQEVREQMRRHLSVTKNNFGSLLYKAHQHTYNTENILAAFEATGISPFNPYRTPLMRDFQARAHSSASETTQAQPSQSNSTHHRNIAAACCEVARDASATAQELQSALINALSLFDGAEARNTLLDSELSMIREAEQTRQAKKPRAGQVGHARVYTQAQIDEVRATEDACDLAKASRAMRKQGNAKSSNKSPPHDTENLSQSEGD